MATTILELLLSEKKLEKRYPRHLSVDIEDEGIEEVRATMIEALLGFELLTLGAQAQRGLL